MQYDMFGSWQDMPNKGYIVPQQEGSSKMTLDEIMQVVKTRYSKFAETGGNAESC